MDQPIKPLEKKYFDIKLETLLPATLTYRILATDPEEAIMLIKKSQPINIKHNLAGKKNLKATVYDAYTSMIKLIKNMVNQ